MFKPRRSRLLDLFLNPLHAKKVNMTDIENKDVPPGQGQPSAFKEVIYGMFLTLFGITLPFLLIGLVRGFSKNVPVFEYKPLTKTDRRFTSGQKVIGQYRKKVGSRPATPEEYSYRSTQAKQWMIGFGLIVVGNLDN